MVFGACQENQNSIKVFYLIEIVKGCCCLWRWSKLDQNVFLSLFFWSFFYDVISLNFLVFLCCFPCPFCRFYFFL